MIALLLFSYACCALGVWFGWYLRGRRVARDRVRAQAAVAAAVAAFRPVQIVYGDPFADDSPRASRERAAQILAAQDSTE